MRTLVVAIAAAVVAAACAPAESPPARPDRSPPEAAATTPAARPPARAGARLVKPRFGFIGGRARTAITDLKAAGLWAELTRHLYIIEISTVPGRRFLPEDGHLADAFRTLHLDAGGRGVKCEIRFYPAAIAADRRRVAEYYALGLIDRPPPSGRHTWASVLAHELAHCGPSGVRGEAHAHNWERRALAALAALSRTKS